MSGLVKAGIGVFTGGTSVWLPYVIIAALAAGGTGYGMWKLIVAPRLEAAELRVEKAETELNKAVEANEETARSIRIMERQAAYDRQATAAAIAEAQATAEQATKVKRDISNVKGAQDAVDPVDLYGNQRLRELRATRRGQNGNTVPAAPGRASAL